MATTIPGVRNKLGAATSDIVAEQIALCKENVKTIKRIAKFRKPREIRDEISRRLRLIRTENLRHFVVELCLNVIISTKFEHTSCTNC